MSEEAASVDRGETLHTGQPPGDRVKQALLNQTDIIVVVVYFALIIATSIASTYRRNRSTVSGFFLAGRRMTWFPIGASLFASNIGSEHFIGLAGSGAAAGIGVGAFELNAIFLLQLLGWVFLPVFLASRVGTLPEYMSKRFGGQRIRIYLAFLSLFLYVFTKISVNFYSGAIFIQQALNWSLWWSVLGTLLIAIFTTTLGGLAAVIYTDTLQFGIMIIGSLIVAFRAFSEVGGYAELQEKYIKAIPSKTIANTTCGVPSTESWVLLQNPASSQIPWPGFIFGQTPASVWYWCADQMIVQRAISAQSLSHAQGATLFAAIIKILPLFVMVLPGMISRVLFTDEVGCVLPEECEKICGNPISCSNIAYPKLVLHLMPQGMRGVMVSVMLAALISDLTSIFNSASTLFTVDIYGSLRPNSSNYTKLTIGRLFVGVLVLISVGWIPIINRTQGGQLYLYIQSIASYIAPPIAAVYILAVLWKGINEQGAFWSLMAGFAVGMCRMTLDFLYMFDAPRCWETVDTRPGIISKVHYMYFATMLFLMTFAVAVIVSLITSSGEEWRLVRTTFWTRHDQQQRADEKTKTRESTAESYELEKRASGSQDDDQHMDSGNQGFWMKSYNWICGFEKSSNSSPRDEEEANNSAIASSLIMKRKERLLLNTILVFVLLSGSALYIGFSINPFTEIEYKEVQSDRLRELGYSPPWH